MKKAAYIILFILLVLNFVTCNCYAFWIWTPESNKWVNPKYSVKETPSEQLEFSLGFYEEKSYEEAIKEFKKLIKNYPRAREAPEAQYYISKCYEDQEKLFSAFKGYQVVIDKYPFSERSPEIIKKQFDIGIKLLEGSGDKGFLKKTFADDSYDVVEVFRTVIKNAPYGEYAAPSQYKIGLYLSEKKLYQESRDEFEKVINDYPDSEWAKASKYQIAMSDALRSTEAQYDQKVTEAAVEGLKDFMSDYPGADLSEKAKEEIRGLREKEAENAFLVAEFYEKQKNYKAAKIYYQSIVNDYKGSIWSSKALERIREVSKKQL
ncbi:MAG: outer membrane protein assembly factor BamD [Candidatus Omnitrophica bacterium]|nr:outer membrane protein assembly factor BamD [Candidatus Omnitrophota bacterium]